MQRQMLLFLALVLRLFQSCVLWNKPVILFLLQMLQIIKLKCETIVDKKGALMLKESNLRNSALFFEDLLKDQRKQNQLSENIKHWLCQKQQQMMMMKASN
jgi:hypothetical protein